MSVTCSVADNNISLSKSMGDSLMYVLEETIGEHMTPAVKQAWQETYKELSTDMIEGFTRKGGK
jgi:hemoglobin-like flavoprotein